MRNFQDPALHPDPWPEPQEFYLILWKPPHLMESYSHLPEGCEEHPHATWEPDECLPDEFDVPWAALVEWLHILPSALG